MDICDNVAVKVVTPGVVSSTDALSSVNVTEGAEVMSDHYASQKYRTHLAHVYVKRALKMLM